MLRSLIGAVSSLAVFAFVGAASAAPVLFTYTGEIVGVTGGALSGIMSVGDTVTIEVVSDNGSASLISQTWDPLDTITATFSAGGYTATFSDGFFTSPAATGFTTDGAGNLIDAAWVGIEIDPTAFDNFGAGGDLNNGSGIAANGDSYTFLPYLGTLGTLTAWAGPVFVSDTNDVPEPSAIALIGLGLAGLCLMKRRNKLN